MAEQIVVAMEGCAKGQFFYEKEGSSYLSFPTPRNAKPSLEKNLTKLVKNVMEIENQKPL